jgi:hypothetical protein
VTYLHDYVRAREILRDQVVPKMMAALMPTMDFLGYEYERLREGSTVDGTSVDSIIVSFPDDLLPEGYRMRIEFSPIRKAPWKAPDGSEVKGPGF